MKPNLPPVISKPQVILPSIESIRPSAIDAKHDAFGKREAANEELYIREVEREHIAELRKKLKEEKKNDEKK